MPYTTILSEFCQSLELADHVLNTEKFLFLHHRTYKLLIMQHKIAPWLKTFFVIKSPSFFENPPNFNSKGGISPPKKHPSATTAYLNGWVLASMQCGLLNTCQFSDDGSQTEWLGISLNEWSLTKWIRV